MRQYLLLLTAAGLALSACGSGNKPNQPPAANNAGVKVDDVASTQPAEKKQANDALSREIAGLPATTRLFEKRDNLALTDTHLESLARFSSLEILDLDGCSNVSDAAVATTLRLQTLRVVRLGRMALKDDALRGLQAHPQVEKLDLSFNEELTDATIDVLLSLPKLTNLNLSGCQHLTGEAVTRLKAAPKLRVLDLTWCGNVSPDAFAQLATAALDELVLDHTGCNDTFLAQLSKQKLGLKRLAARQCPMITADGARAFRIAQPKVSLDVS